MSDAQQQTKIFPLENRGVVSKRDPALLQPGQLLGATNVVSLQEGNICPRFGTRKLGVMAGGAMAPHTVAKLSIVNQSFAISGATNATPIVITTDNPHGWLTGFMVGILGVNGNTAANSAAGNPWTITVTGPTTFSLNTSIGSGAYTNGGEATLASGDPSIRYIGEGGNIWRTLDDYVTFTEVAQGVMGSYNPFTRWSEISYSAGSTGNPYAYFACPGKMLKDQGNSPFSTLESWGITPALAAASASNAVGNYQNIILLGLYNGGYSVEVTAHGYTTGQAVVISGVLNTDGTSSNANGTWVITVLASYLFYLNNSLFQVSPAASTGTSILAGPDSTQPGGNPYDYVFTFRDPATSNEGNPSPFMQTALAVQSQNGIITVTVWGSPDPKILTAGGSQSIFIYRRGGSYSDGLFRFVGFVTNPGVDGTGAPLSATLTDTNADIALLYAAQVEFDNDPPVTSALRFPINATISGGPFAPGWNTVTLSQAIVGVLTIGTSVTVGNTTNQEICVIAALPYNSAAANTTCLLYFQQNHVDGEPVLIDSVSGQPCSVGISAFDQIFLAADANNPSTSYQSKSGMPESFPTIDALGNTHTILIGSPSNPIMNLVEFRGNILYLNQNSLSEVSVYQGVMYGPYDTPAERGLTARWAFVSTGYVVFYLANDGIYAWDGSQSKKITESIDPAFRGVFINQPLPVTPVSYAPADLVYARMEYYRNQLYFLYSSGGGLLNMHILRYDVLYNRWEPEIYNAGLGPYSEIFLEKDTNAFILARFRTSGNAISQNDQFGTEGSTDDFTLSTGVDGIAIPMVFQTAFFPFEESNRVKLVQDIFIELANQDAVTVKVFYDYASSPDPVDQFTIPASPSLGGNISNVTSVGGLIQVTSNGHELISGNRVIVSEVNGVSSSIGVWTVTVVDANNFTLNGSVFSGAYISSGIFAFIQRQQITLPLQLSGDPELSSGKEAFSASVQIFCSSTYFNTFYALGFRFIDRDAIQQGITTDWLTLGSNNDKRLYQLHIEHSTGGISITVQMDIRYGINGVMEANDVASFILNSTDKTTVTLPIPETGFPGQMTICKSVRLRPIYTPNSNFRIFMKPTFDADVLPPDVVLFTKLEDLGWPCDKLAHNLEIDIDTGGIPCLVTAEADNVNIQVFTMTTTANDRKRNLPFEALSPLTNNNPIGRLWRLTTSPGAGGKAQIFSWKLVKDDLPPYITLFTTWQDFGWPYEKIARNLILDINTGGVPCDVTLEADNGIIQSFTVTTTLLDRKRMLPLASGPEQNPQPIGKLFRLYAEPGGGGLAQIYSWSLDFIKEPPIVPLVDTYELSLGSLGWKLIKQVWLFYLSPYPVNFTIITDGGATFYSVDLPAHPTRSVERFYLPDSTGTGPVVLLKSKTYRLILTAVGAPEVGNNGLKFYSSESGLEFCVTSASQRAAYRKLSISEATKLQA